MKTIESEEGSPPATARGLIEIPAAAARIPGLARAAGTDEAPDLAGLLAIFPGSEFALEDFTAIDPRDMPEPYRALLVHEDHMTTTLERRYGGPLALVVRDRRRGDREYARRLILTAGPNDRPVLAGIARLRLDHCREEVTRQILDESAPLGRILISCEAFRSILPDRYFRVRLNPALRALLRSGPRPEQAWARTARILCGDRPVVELLEIVAPETVDPPKGPTSEPSEVTP